MAASSRDAHWSSRPEGKPFFAVFNHTISHESQIRNRIAPENQIHDPAKVRIPAYHPDTPEVRKDWAQYYDRITMMDKLVGRTLKEVNDAGLAEDTIVFYYGDHGSGMPRNKRWPYFSGLNVPLIVHVPEKYKHLAPAGYEAGGTSDQLVGFIDFAPTALSIAGMKPPAHMQDTPSWANMQHPGKNIVTASAGAWTSDTTWCARYSTGATFTSATCRTIKSTANSYRVHVPDTHHARLA